MKTWGKKKKIQCNPKVELTKHTLDRQQDARKLSWKDKGLTNWMAEHTRSRKTEKKPPDKEQ